MDDGCTYIYRDRQDISSDTVCCIKVVGEIGWMMDALIITTNQKQDSIFECYFLYCNSILDERA